MYRIDAQGFVANGNGTGKNAFTNGNIATPVQATILDANWLNELQEEFANIVEVLGATALTKGARSQGVNAIRSLVDEFLMNNISGTSLGTTAFNANGAQGGMYYPHPLSAFGYTAVGVNTGGTANQIQVSTTGLTWTTASTVPAGAATGLFGICYNPTADLYVATGKSGVTGGVVTAPGTATNTTWTGRICGGGTNILGDVEWCPTLALYVTCVTSGANATYYTSPDAITWTLRTISGATAGVIKTLCWTGGALIAVVYNSSTFVSEIWRSLNGTTWTNVVLSAALPSGGSNQPFMVRSDKAGTVVATFYTNTSPFADKYYAYRSTDDGVTWNAIIQPVAPSLNSRPGLGSFSITKLAYDKGLWVGQTNDNFWLSSSDGNGWHLHTQSSLAGAIIAGPRPLIVGPTTVLGLPSNRYSI